MNFSRAQGLFSFELVLVYGVLLYEKANSVDVEF